MPGPFSFAWSGGVITEQTTLVTNGTTHGASPVTRAIVGDTTAGQLINIADVSGLEVDAYYELAGPGIADGTRFLYDGTILSGLQTSVNLSASSGSEQTSATFTATKALALGTALGILTDGSAAVTLTDTGGLPAGTYAVFGTGIGETDVPEATTDGTTAITGGGVMIVSACLLAYDGADGGTLSIVAATPSTSTGITTYTVAAQEVRATSSGTYPLALSGFTDEDPASITDIPATALGGLEPGLRYNISGNGIPLGATFVAPVSGTEIIVDLDATASDFDAILTITGPRTPNAPFDPLVHNRFDEEVISLEIAQEEGGFATLTIDIRNPNIGLLALGRNLWCWLSWDQAWPDGAPDLVPLFNGRLVGVPRLQAGEVVQLQFLARPDDFNAQKAAIAELLQVLPYYDPIWLATNVTADTVLETYSALWHIDRTSLSLTTSDVLDGEDGTIDIGEDQSIYDKFSLSYGQPPLTAVTVSGTVSWQQQADGVLDVTQNILDAFYATGSGYSKTFAKTSWGSGSGWSGTNITTGTTAGGGGLIQTLGEFKSSWPKPGTSIGGGWSLSNGVDPDGVALCYITQASKTTKPADGGWLNPLGYKVDYTAPLPTDDDSGFTVEVDLITSKYGSYSITYPFNAFKVRMNLDFKANRKRTETVTAVVTAGVQRELSDPAESDREMLTLTSTTVAEGVDPEGALPIGSLAYRSYFQTERGTSSFEYLLLAARAKLRARVRAVDISFAVPWAAALPIGLRHNVRYTDRRLPGGAAIGKVKNVKLTMGGGIMLGEFTIGCSIGTAEVVTPLAGVPSYVDAGYVEPGWQAVSGAQVELISDEIAYQTLDDFVIADDGLALASMTADAVVNACVVTNGILPQLNALSKYQNTVVTSVGGDPITTLTKLNTAVLLDLKPVAGAEYHTSFYPAVTPLTLPQTIDLAAPAGE